MGPNCTVLLREPLNEEKQAALAAWLGGLDGGVEAVDSRTWRFTVRDGAPLGCRHDGPARTFTAGLESSDLGEEVETEDLIDSLGYVPEQALVLDAAEGSADDHRLLAALAATLADRLDGWVDLNGNVRGETGPDLEELPGRIFTVEFFIAEGDTLEHQVVDAEWLRAWLAHPGFRMVA